jgi:nitroreductase
VPDSLIDADGVLDALATTRAIRRYRDEPIPDEDLSRIMFAATRAPSGSNRQSFRFVVLRESPEAVEAKAVLGEAFRAAWGAKRSDDSYDEGTGVDAESPKARAARAMQQFVDDFERTPVVVLACMVGRRGHITDGGSVYPACQNLLLAARALGYGGVMTMWHQLVEDRLHDILDIPTEVPILATIPLGRPAGNHGPVRRRPAQELIYDGRWKNLADWVVEPDGTRHTGTGPRGSRRAEQ